MVADTREMQTRDIHSGFLSGGYKDMESIPNNPPQHSN